MLRVQSTVGIVSRLASDHTALLVHGAFNASISQRQHGVGMTFEIGQRVRFVILSITIADGLLSMLGDAIEGVGK